MASRAQRPATSRGSKRFGRTIQQRPPYKEFAKLLQHKPNKYMSLVSEEGNGGQPINRAFQFHLRRIQTCNVPYEAKLILHDLVTFIFAYTFLRNDTFVDVWQERNYLYVELSRIIPDKLVRAVFIDTASRERAWLTKEDLSTWYPNNFPQQSLGWVSQPWRPYAGVNHFITQPAQVIQLYEEQRFPYKGPIESCPYEITEDPFGEDEKVSIYKALDDIDFLESIKDQVSGTDAELLFDDIFKNVLAKPPDELTLAEAALLNTGSCMIQGTPPDLPTNPSEVVQVQAFMDLYYALPGYDPYEDADPEGDEYWHEESALAWGDMIEENFPLHDPDEYYEDADHGKECVCELCALD